MLNQRKLPSSIPFFPPCCHCYIFMFFYCFHTLHPSCFCYITPNKKSILQSMHCNLLQDLRERLLALLVMFQFYLWIISCGQPRCLKPFLVSALQFNHNLNYIRMWARSSNMFLSICCYEFFNTWKHIKPCIFSGSSRCQLKSKSCLAFDRFLQHGAGGVPCAWFNGQEENCPLE